MNRRNLTLLLIFVLLLGAFSVVNAQEADGEPILIGALFDLSGPTGDVGTPYAEGELGYVEWLNANGGINGRPIVLVSQDYAYNVETAENLYTEFTEQDLVAFMGWGTGDSEALRGRVAEDELPFISASYSANLNDPMDSAPYNFIVAPTYGDQLVIMMVHMLHEWEEAGNDVADMSVVLFHHDSPFGQSPVPDGVAYGEEAGVAFADIAMPGGATDYTAELQQADDIGVTHIIVQNVSSPAALLASNALEFFGDPEFYDFACLNWCADELFVSLAGDAAEGTLGVLPFAPTTVEVEGQENAREFLGGQEALEEASLHYTQGWTAMDIMAEAIRRTLDAEMELTGANVRAALEGFSENPYETGGITAAISFTAEDHRATRASNTFVVEMGSWVQVGELIDLADMMMEE